MNVNLKDKTGGLLATMNVRPVLVAQIKEAQWHDLKCRELIDRIQYGGEMTFEMAKDGVL